VLLTIVVAVLGIWLILVGLRLIGRPEGEDKKWDEWWSKWGRHCRVLGTVMVVVAGIRVVAGAG